METILALIPKHKLYVEPFVGSGAVFFNKDEVPSILNDLDNKTINGLKLIKRVNVKKLCNKNLEDFDTIEKITDFYFNKKISTIEDKLIHHKIYGSNGFSGRPVTKIIYRASNPLKICNNIEIYKQKLQNATLLNEDYKKVISQYDSKDTFFFLDPPYENTSSSFGYAEGSNTFNFEELRQICDAIKGTFMLTLNNSPYIRKLFKGYNIKKINVPNTWSYKMPNLKKYRKELIIMNYKF
jgi:DNA adenine methylase